MRSMTIAEPYLPFVEQVAAGWEEGSSSSPIAVSDSIAEAAWSIITDSTGPPL